MTLQVLLQDHSHPLPTSRLPESALPLEYRLEIPNGLQTKSETALIRFAARHGLEVAYFDFKCLEATRWVNAVVQQKPIRVPVPKYCLVSPHQGRLPSIKYTIDGSRANVRSLDSSETHLLNVVNLGLRKRFPAQTPIYALSLLMGLAVSVAFNFGLKTYKLGPVGWAVFFTMTMSSFFAMSWIADRFLTRPCVEFVATAQLPEPSPKAGAAFSTKP